MKPVESLLMNTIKFGRRKKNIVRGNGNKQRKEKCNTEERVDGLKKDDVMRSRSFKPSGGLQKFLKRKGPTPLAEYIKKEKWHRVDAIIFNEKYDRNSLIAEVEEQTGMNCLSLICMMHPPVRVVVKVTDLVPDLVNRLDTDGRMALHYASGWGASPQVVSFLTAMNSDAAAGKDNQGKTPLILACEGMHPTKLSDSGNIFCDKVGGPTIEVLEALIVAAWHVVSDTDNNNNRALDYAKSLKRKVKAFLEQATEMDARIKEEMKRPEKRSSRPRGSKVKLSHNCTTIWDRNELSKEHDEREINKRLIDFLSIEDRNERIDDLPLDNLKVTNPDALYAAEFGYLASKQGLKSDNSIPSVIDVNLDDREDLSACTVPPI